jgi:signal transduction histidine kinase
MLGLAVFELDEDGLRSRELAPIVAERGMREDATIRLEARTAPMLSVPVPDASTPTSTIAMASASPPPPPPAPPPEDELCRLSLRSPLDDLDLVAARREAAVTDGLGAVAGNLRTLAIALSLVGLAAGAFVMTRAVRKEMKASELKSDFVTTVTHELKTPLTSIGMFAETLLMGRVKDEDEERECLEIIAKETDRLTRLIDRVLTFSKIEAKRKRFDLRLTNIGALVTETVELFKTQMRGAPRPFTVGVSILHELRDVLVDRGSVQEVLLNLLSNAYKYGGEAKRIEVTITKRRRWAMVEVRDWGIGIPRAEQKKIFRKFYRTDDRLTRDVEGSGIGLTLALSIARAHQGDITVKSAVGQGSTFTLWLPW